MEYLIEEHKRLSALYVDATVAATKRSDYRHGLAEDLRKRLSDLEYALMSKAELK